MLHAEVRRVLAVDDGGLAAVLAGAWAREIALVYGADVRIVDREAHHADDAEVAAEAVEDDRDLIVLAGIEPSRALAIVDATGATVLLARELPPPRRILVAIDRTRPSVPAARIAVDLCARWGVHTEVLHVVPGLVPVALPINAQHAVLQPLLDADLDVRSVLVNGDPAEQIALATLAAENTLVVMGRRAPGKHRRHEAPSVSQQVLRRTRGSVLVVPDSPLV